MAHQAKTSDGDVSPDASSIEVVRIYFSRLHLVRRDRSLWERITRPLAAVWLAREALRGGITFAVVTMGTAGFVRAAGRVEVATPEGISEKLPSCLELVGHPSRIARFLEAQSPVL